MAESWRHNASVFPTGEWAAGWTDANGPDFSPDAASPGQAAAVSSRGSGTVLVAEDEDGVRRLLVRMLRRAGYEVVEARDGQEALERSQGLQLDVVVTDLDMPRLDGVGLARALGEARPELPILMVSGSAPDPLQGADLPAEHCAFLEKPFTEELLLESLRELLGE
jgi:two-component system cell cycle sensor histidine kinase/response regulator CckA